MAPTTPSDTSEDFVILDVKSSSDIPFRPRISPCEADNDHASPDVDEDLEHISSPESVRSLDSLSPSPSLVQDDLPTSCSYGTYIDFSTPRSPSPPRRSLQPHLTSNTDSTNTNLYPVQQSTPQSSPPATRSKTCYNHVTIDQQIMDLLIENALSSRLDQQSRPGSSHDHKLRQQMMTRYRSLPPHHTVVQSSIKHVDGNKALFPDQHRTMSDLEFVYRTVFTELERLALTFVVECHIRHFEIACSFYGSFMPCGRGNLFQAMQQPEAPRAKSLAMKIQHTVLGRLDMERAFRYRFDDLRRQTRSRIPSLGSPANYIMVSCNVNDMPPETEEERRINATMSADHQLGMSTIKEIFHTTISNLPNTDYTPGDPNNTFYVSGLKREIPDTESDHEEDVYNPPTKKQTLARRSSCDIGPSSGSLQPTNDSRMPSYGTRLESLSGKKSRNNDPPLERDPLSYTCYLELIEEAPEAELDSRSPQKSRQNHKGATQQVRRNVPSLIQGIPPLQTTDNASPKISSQTSRCAEETREKDFEGAAETFPQPYSPDLSAHFGAQPRKPQTGGESSTRGYRSNTLLAQPTQLPIPPATGNHVELGLSETDQQDFKRTERGYSFAPATDIHGSNNVLRSWKDEIVRLEDNRERERQNRPGDSLCDWRSPPPTSTRRAPQSQSPHAQLTKGPNNSLPLRPKDVGPIGKVSKPGNAKTEGLSVKVEDRCASPSYRASFYNSNDHKAEHSVSNGPLFTSGQHSHDKWQHRPAMTDYQMQLVLLEQQNRARLLGKKRTEFAHNSSTGKNDVRPDPNNGLAKMLPGNNSMPRLIWRDGNSWLAFEFKDSSNTDHVMEYCVLASVARVDTDRLSSTFKDANCLHEECDGWMTSERARLSQFDALQTVLRKYDNSSRVNEADKSTEESRSLLKKKSLENKTAWALAELNGCLRGKKDVLQKAVRLLLGFQDVEGPMSKPSMHRTAPVKNEFLVMSPDQIMQDADTLEDSSSDSGESDEDYDPFECEAPDFPMAFLDTQKVRCITFQFNRSASFNPDFYSIRADIDCVQGGTEMNRSVEAECICTRTSEPRNSHDEDCRIGWALQRLNPILRGKENKRLLTAAVVNYWAVVSGRGWIEATREWDCGLRWGYKMINEVVPEPDGFNAFSSYYQYNDGWRTQCVYCSLILTPPESDYDAKVIHLRGCEGYRRFRSRSS